MKKFIYLLSMLLYLLSPLHAFAHEAYVLSKEDFQKGLEITTQNPFAPLLDASHFGFFIQTGILVAAAYFLVILWSTTKMAERLDKLVRKAKSWAPVFIRIAIAAAFFEGAKMNAVFGPELPLGNIQGGEIIQPVLYALSFMIFIGLFTRLAALIGMIIFFYLCTLYNIYMLNYLNYFGELLVLVLFGSSFLSADKYLFNKKSKSKTLAKLADLETPIVRVLYGTALVYAAYSVKFLHQDIPIAVYNQYHLENFFHMDAQFVASGAGLSEMTIGLFLILGFAMRFTILISLVFFVLSLMYFGEMVWPHYILFGISFCLLINSADKFTIDHYLIPWARKVRKKILHF